jgi:hypothetical protein
LRTYQRRRQRSILEEDGDCITPRTTTGVALLRTTVIAFIFETAIFENPQDGDGGGLKDSGETSFLWTSVTVGVLETTLIRILQD